MLSRRLIATLPLLAVAGGARAQDASRVVAGAEALLRRFRDNGAWSLFWQTLGRAEGALIAPRVDAEGLFMVQESGVGLVLARHGAAWSDPVGIVLSETSVGLQGGVRTFGLAVAVLNRSALDTMIRGGVSYGGSGGLALGDLGLGTQGTVGTTGVQSVAVTVSEGGAFAGSGIGGMRVSPSQAMNAALNGDAPPEQVLAREGRHTAGRGVRELLGEATRAAG